MKKTNPLRTSLNVDSPTSLVIGSNPIFSTDRASERSGAFFVESLPHTSNTNAQLPFTIPVQIQAKALHVSLGE